MKISLFFVIILFFYGCRDERSKKHLHKTYRICDEMYVQKFLVFGGGAYGGDVHSHYITDSTHFRVFIGTEDTASEILYTKCKGDSLIVEKSNIDRNTNSKKVKFIAVYFKKELIREGKFD